MALFLRIMLMAMMMMIAPAPSSSAASAADSTDETVTIVDLSQDLPEDAAAMASSPGAAAIHDVASNDPFIRAAVVLEKGSVVAQYIRDDDTNVVDPETPFHVWSTTKSWMSLLVGVLVDGNLLSIDETLGDIFADDSDAWADVTDNETIPFRKAVTVEEMLTMSSGLISPLDEFPMIPGVELTEEDFERDLGNWGGSSLSDSLALPDIGSKGNFSYLATSNILSYVVKERTDMTPRQYLAENVMAHLGIAESDYNWLQNGEGIEPAFHGLELTPLQMAKFGQLYLQGGRSQPATNEDHHRLISQSWIDASFTQHSVDSVTNLGYGYLFWKLGSAYCAFGMFGQDICIDQNLERVVVQQRDPDYVNYLQGSFIIAPVGLNPALSFAAQSEDTNNSYPSAAPSKFVSPTEDTNNSSSSAPSKVANSSPIGPIAAVASWLLGLSTLLSLAIY
mmetsp:Transcript_9314/g.16534  ORF Transcript_9314/g.16534 Transcript_9314/m.16534 type:complete len:450 (+) Transcript_9314:84-1433(+)